MRFESGSLGMITGICPCGYGYDARVEIIGEKGILQIGELQGEAIVVCTDRDHGLVTPVIRTWGERFAWGYIYELEHFVDCARSGKPSRPPVKMAAGRSRACWRRPTRCSKSGR